MAFPVMNLFSSVSSQVATGSAIGLIGSILAATAFIVVPAASFLLWVSQKDAIR